MEKHGRFEQEIEFAEAARRGVATGHAPDEREKTLHGLVGYRGAKSYLVGALEAKANDIAVLQGLLVGFLSVNENSAMLATVFKVVTVGFKEDRCATSGNTVVRKLEMVSTPIAPTDEKG
jgi:hypothetical protein